MQINRTILTEEEFKNLRMPYPNNLVVVEMPQYEGDKKTESGIIYGFNKEVQYAEGNENHIADVADVYGTVVRCPEKFYFAHKTSYSPSWNTTIEIQVGDLVWFNPLIATNCTEIGVNHKTYKLIPYDDLFVARRRMFGGYNNVSGNLISWGERVICLNGYCIVERVHQKSLGSLDVLSQDRIDETRGIIRYCGSCNLEYENKKWTDFVELKEGDEVLFMPNHKPIPLERKSYNAHFEAGKLYYAVQRRYITMVL
jgi:hypothetical protein